MSILDEYSSRLSASEVLDEIGLRTEAAECSVTFRMAMINDRLWLCGDVNTDSGAFIESFQQKNEHRKFVVKKQLKELIAICDEFEDKARFFSPASRKAMKEYYGVCLLLDGKRIAW